MGGSGIAGNVLQAVGTATLPVPITVLKHYRTPAFVGARTLAFALSYSGRHRGDGRDGPRCARRRRHVGRRSRAAASWRSWPQSPGRCTCPAPSTSRCRASRSARSSRRCSSSCSAWGCCPRRTPGSCGRNSSSPSGATSAGRRPTRRATRHASWPASSGAPSRSSTGAVASAGLRRCAGSSR